MRYLISIFLLSPFSLFATFEDYPEIQSFLSASDIKNEKVFILLNNKRLFSTDYHPSAYARVRDDSPRYPTRMVQKGIEGYVEIGFTVNEDGSTSDHAILESQPSDYFDEYALIEAKGLRYRKDLNTSYINTKGSFHKHRFTFNLPEESRKVPNGVFSCMELVYQDKFQAAKSCAENKVENISGYTIPYAMSIYYMGQEDEAIKLLSELLKDQAEESFYVKALSATALTIFLFDNERYEEIINLEPYITDIRKVGYSEALINSFYFLGVSLFYNDRKIDSLYYLKLSLQDSNCKVSLQNINDDVKASKAQSLYRLLPGKNCYADSYNRTQQTFQAINNII